MYRIPRLTCQNTSIDGCTRKQTDKIHNHKYIVFEFYLYDLSKLWISYNSKAESSDTEQLANKQTILCSGPHEKRKWEEDIGKEKLKEKQTDGRLAE